MEKDKIYFGDNGLTSTSANFIANQAKEMVQSIQEELASISFLNSEIGIIGSTMTPTSKGVTTLDGIEDSVDTIVKAHSLIAWLREAIKAKETLRKEVSGTDIETWCKENGKEYPAQPTLETSVTQDEVLATWSIKDRNRYLTLSAKVSAYGKLLHPNGSYSKARAELKKKINNPVYYQESGRDTIIHSCSPSIKASVVDAKFFELQAIWRKAQAELNGLEHKIELAIEKDTNAKNSKYTSECTFRQHMLETLIAEYRAWKDKKLQDIAALKIVIPHDLQDIYQTVNALAQ